ncbi:hypothetical protein OIU85_014387 [Salix viminalis]|uniref:Pollen Ole e 1 allergen and extensin family protein n=2 Tax=Salix viminalis TaxID=40686 RepID=A0A9Q0NIH9_SALVM|nr:hypothetical protein OIU85_014387 [Salix viminalis]
MKPFYQHQLLTSARPPFIEYGFLCLSLFLFIGCNVHTIVSNNFASMEFHPLALLLLFGLTVSGIQLSTCQVLKGRVSCLDCGGHYDYSEIKVGVKCDKVRKLATATTQSDGSFEVKLSSSDTSTTATPLICRAKLLGGPSQLYVSRQNMASRIVRTHDSSSYTISAPLAFSSACSADGGKCGVSNEYGSSKTVDLPLPREWGLAPSSYYVPFIPIIGIP